MALRTIITALTILVVSATFALADPIANGDFGLGGAGWTQIPADTPDLTVFYSGLARIDESVDWVDGISCAGIQQSFSRDTMETHLCFRFQVVTVVTGEGPDESDEFRVQLGGTVQHIAWSHDVDTLVLDDFFGDDYTPPGPWRTAAIELPISIAVGEFYPLSFRLIGDEFDDRITSVFIDDVHLCSVVPVPGAMLLGSIGLGYAGLRLRRRS